MANVLALPSTADFATKSRKKAQKGCGATIPIPEFEVAASSNSKGGRGTLIRANQH
jgi:hypothetical protein